MLLLLLLPLVLLLLLPVSLPCALLRCLLPVPLLLVCLRLLLSLRKNSKGSIQSATRATLSICYTLLDLKE